VVRRDWQVSVAPPTGVVQSVPLGFHNRDDSESAKNRSKTYTAVWLALILDPIDPKTLFNIASPHDRIAKCRPNKKRA
jgi:hypothetical protein